jgi:hypothetical protein
MSLLPHYLKGTGAQPQPDNYAAITGRAGEPFTAENVIRVERYSQLARRWVSERFQRPAILANPASGLPSGPLSDPVLEAGIVGAGELNPFVGLPPQPNVIDPTAATYAVPVSRLAGRRGLLIAGQPKVTLRALTASLRLQLNVRLWDVAPNGMRELITRGTYTLERLAVDPTRAVDVVIPTAGNLWRAPAGHTLQLEITNVDLPYLMPSRIPSVTHISEVTLHIPAR